MEELEIEFKCLINPLEYHMLIDFFNCENFFVQTNHYFDDDTMTLKEHNIACRVRVKNETYEFTTKERQEIGNLETNQMISKSEFLNLLDNHIIPNGVIADKLSKIELTTPLKNHVSIETTRTEFKYVGGLLVFDHTKFNGIEDYEIEYEVSDFHKGKEIFMKLLNDFHIDYHKSEPKIRRAYKYKNND